MGEDDRLAERFEQHRPRLRAVAHRMLGSRAEAEDAVQDAWLRLHRAGAEEIENLGGWLTTVVARECLHVLRSRRRRPETPWDAGRPDLIVLPDGDLDPEQQAMLADAVGVALLVVLDRLPPAERLAFVLHDTFGLPFEDVAAVVGRTPAAARQLASRARRRVRGAGVDEPAPDLARQRRVVGAFYAAASSGDYAALVRVLDPDVVQRTDLGAGRPAEVLRGAAAVAGRTRVPRGGRLRAVLVNGAVGALITRDGQPYQLLVFTVAGERITRIDVLRDPDLVGRVAAGLDRSG